MSLKRLQKNERSMPEGAMRLKAFLPRLLIGLVAFLNLQCAFLFLLRPNDYISGFELEGLPGTAAVRGMGVLFIMWNIPYLIALWDPFRQRTALYAAVCMQAVGLLGESWIFSGIPMQHSALSASIIRFIYFDFSGLVLLGLALLMVSQPHSGEIVRRQAGT